MGSDLGGGAAAIYIGAAIFAFGLYAYIGPSAAVVFRRMMANTGGAFPLAIIFVLVPAGIAAMLFGVAFAIGKNWFTDHLEITGIALVGLGIVHIFIHPRWSQPKWMR